MKSFIVALLALTLYYVLLILYFLDVFNYFHAVQGYDLDLQVSGYSILGLALVLPLGILVGVRIRRGGDIVLFLMFFMSIMPTIVLACLVPDEGVWHGLLALILGFLLTCACYRIKLRLSVFRVAHLGQGWVLLLVMAIALCMVLYNSFGYIPDLVSFFDVYGRRAEYVSSLENINPIVGYIIMWLQFLILPITFLYAIYGFKMGKYGLAAIFALVTSSITLLIYAYTALKSSVLMFALLGFILIFFSRERDFFRALLFIAFGVAACKLISLLPGGDYVYYHTLRRLIISPALDGYFYIQYFDTWFNAEIPRAEHAATIANVYYGTNGNANAGVYPSLYASDGYLGIILGSIALGFFLKLCDSLLKSTHRIFAIGVIGTYGYVLVNAHLFTSMLSYGLGLVPLLVWLLPANKHPNEEMY